MIFDKLYNQFLLNSGVSHENLTKRAFYYSMIFMVLLIVLFYLNVHLLNQIVQKNHVDSYLIDKFYSLYPDQISYYESLLTPVPLYHYLLFCLVLLFCFLSIEYYWNSLFYKGVKHE